MRCSDKNANFWGTGNVRGRWIFQPQQCEDWKISALVRSAWSSRRSVCASTLPIGNRLDVRVEPSAYVARNERVRPSAGDARSAPPHGKSRRSAVANAFWDPGIVSAFAGWKFVIREERVFFCAMPEPQRANFGGIPLLQQCVKSYHSNLMRNDSRYVKSNLVIAFFLTLVNKCCLFKMAETQTSF